MEDSSSVECGSSVAGRENAGNRPNATTRKRRNRSDGSESEDSPELPHVSKKMSMSDLDMPLDMDRVALLDAGAQYGKVIAA